MHRPTHSHVYLLKEALNVWLLQSNSRKLGSSKHNIYMVHLDHTYYRKWSSFLFLRACLSNGELDPIRNIPMDFLFSDLGSPLSSWCLRDSSHISLILASYGIQQDGGRVYFSFLPTFHGSCNLPFIIRKSPTLTLDFLFQSCVFQHITPLTFLKNRLGISILIRIF